MPQPTPGDVHVNRPLTNISIAMIQDETNFIADQVFPNVPVDKQSDLYYAYDNAYWNSDDMQLRGPADESAGGVYKVDASANYFAHVYAFHKDIPDMVRANADVPLNPDREATRYVTQKGLIKREKLFASTFMTGGVWTHDVDGVAAGANGTTTFLRWNLTNSTPVEDVWLQKENILKATGFEPNTLVLGYPVYRALINHANLIDRVKYGNTSGVAMIDTNELAQVFKVDRVLIMRSIFNSAKEGATGVHDFIAGKVAGLFYSAPSPGLMTPSAGYIFSWTGYVGAGPAGNRISKFRIEEKKVDRVEIEMAFDLKLVSAPLGAFWDTIVS